MRSGDDTIVPDFYTRYGVEHGKPVALVETRVLYNTTAGAGQAAEFDLDAASTSCEHAPPPHHLSRFTFLEVGYCCLTT